jgi:glycerol-3-phosphate dehydrogenase (NAD(P)+)
MTACAVVGAGAWGTALADLLAANGHAVRLWAREADVVECIVGRHENVRFLAGFALSSALAATTVLSDAVRDAELVVFAVPSAHLREVAERAAPDLKRGATLGVATKGIEEGTLAVMTQVAHEATRGAHPVVAISGPSFAAEVAARQPTAVVAASTRPAAAELVQRAFASQHFRVYTHADVMGVTLGGSLKNVMAVATGISEGLGLGANSRAALVTRGLAEMTRLGVALGARASTFAGLAGLGDLVLTCTGALSRNRALGEAIGRGLTLEEAVAAGGDTVAEGVVTARSAGALGEREGVEMPIVQAVNRVLFEGRPVRRAIADLMERELRAEQD